MKQLLLEAKATSEINIECQEVEVPFINDLRQYMLNRLREIEAAGRVSDSQIKDQYLILRDTQQFNALIAAVYSELLNTFFVKDKTTQQEFMYEVIDKLILGEKAKKHESIYKEQITDHLCDIARGRNSKAQDIWFGFRKI